MKLSHFLLWTTVALVALHDCRSQSLNGPAECSVIVAASTCEYDIIVTPSSAKTALDGSYDVGEQAVAGLAGGAAGALIGGAVGFLAEPPGDESLFWYSSTMLFGMSLGASIGIPIGVSLASRSTANLRWLIPASLGLYAVELIVWHSLKPGAPASAEWLFAATSAAQIGVSVSIVRLLER